MLYSLLLENSENFKLMNPELCAFKCSTFKKIMNAGSIK